jgi:glycosyltransferase involved in cell wall biosynthesis
MPATVCHIITKLELGGAQQNTLFTVGHLDRTRFRPVLITGEVGLLDTDAKAIAGVEFHQVPVMAREIRPWQDLRAVVGMAILLRKIKPDIVHTHSSKAGILGRLAARLAGVPVIIHSIHGYGFTRFQPSLQRRFLIAAERLAARFTTKFFAVSEANRRMGLDLGLFRAEQCRVVRSGVDLGKIRNIRIDPARKKRELGMDPNVPVIGMVGPLKPQKAPLDFVLAAARIHREKPEVQFLLVGDGELRRKVDQTVDELGLRRVFHLVGWRRDVPEILRCLDVFMLTSLWEGLPRVYLEAVASGVPVVGTRVDGACEVILDDVNGYLVPPGDVEGLANRVLRLLGQPALVARMKQQGDALTSEFDIYEMVRLQEREYARLLADHVKGFALSPAA